MTKKTKASGAGGADATIARNKKARYAYDILDTYEAGLSLLGSEVKSLRHRDVSINEAFARPRGDELYILGMNIKPYKQANILNHEPTRPRKLLLHRKEIDRIRAKLAERRLTLVPLRLYWKHGIAKVKLGLARGKRKYDKRQTLKKREAERDIARARRRRGQGS
jgi:SsrA-binding protein